MTQSRVNIKIVIETEDKTGRITKIEQWDIITACVVAARAAIEHYVAPSQRQKALEACSRVMEGPLPSSVVHHHTTVASPFTPEDEL